jgi:glycosyltransferase involved in cell wall biosynthesis
LTIFHPLLCYYPSQAGGPSNTLYWLNSSLAEQGVNTNVLATTFGLKPSFEITELNSNLNSPLKTVRFIDNRGVSFIWKAFKQLKHCDIVQFSSLFFPPTLPIILYSIFKKKAIILAPRGELYNSALTTKPLRKKIWIALFKLFQKHVHFLATNHEERQLIKSHFPKARSIASIPNYIELPNREIVPQKTQFIFLGRINPIKNLEVLIKGFKRAHDATENEVKLLIVGTARLAYEQEYYLHLKKVIEDLNMGRSIEFKGHIEGNQKNKLLAESLALVLPSKSENFGNVVLEALAQGTPVIASKNTPWEILEQANAGFWIGATVNELERAFIKILTLSEEKNLLIRKNAYDLCNENFNIKNNIQKWLDYYKHITTNVQE